MALRKTFLELGRVVVNEKIIYISHSSCLEKGFEDLDMLDNMLNGYCSDFRNIRTWFTIKCTSWWDYSSPHFGTFQYMMTLCHTSYAPYLWSTWFQYGYLLEYFSHNYKLSLYFWYLNGWISSNHGSSEVISHFFNIHNIFNCTSRWTRNILW